MACKKRKDGAEEKTKEEIILTRGKEKRRWKMRGKSEDAERD